MYERPMNMPANMGQRPSWLPDEYRQTPRQPTTLAVSVSSPRVEPVEMDVIDISHLGCRIRGPLNARVGTFVEMSVPGFSSFSGWIVWHRANEFGLDFAHPLPAPVVDHLLGLGSPA